MDGKFIDVEAKSLYNVIETFERKIVNLSYINEEVLEKLNEKELSSLPEEFFTYFKDIIKLNKLYEHTEVIKCEVNREVDDGQGRDEPDDEREEKRDSQGDNEWDDERNDEIGVHREHQDLVDKIKKYCFCLCKIFKENESLSTTLNSLSDKKNHDFFKFLGIVKDLKDIFLVKFQTTAEEQRKRIESLEELKEEEQKTQNEEKKLNDELELVRKKSHEELKDLQQILMTKENELKNLKMSSEESIKKLLDKMPVNNLTEDLENINALLDKTKNAYDDQIRAYQDLEVNLVKKNMLIELDIQNYIDSIDAEIEEMDQEIQLWDNKLRENKIIDKELDATMLKKKVEVEEKNFLKELTDKRRNIIMKRENEDNEAATIIQAYIRAVKERNIYSEYEKKKKKKKKKKELATLAFMLFPFSLPEHLKKKKKKKKKKNSLVYTIVNI
ncbi:pre-mRNA splicing factor, putative [Plasmodium knowlesi strain H]|uniref:Dynein regulatory complex protein 10 n=1 Tax=Plasmodium knowlesi (strain H) TaxID=5851 RepID=A0A193QPF8_PLAKH|nr:pre-mRNA splicing factor, putative [Plasmodium knowlesi strain H]